MGGHHHGHDHAHGHSHSHGGHSHAPASFDRAFAIGIGLNIVFVAVEAIVGLRIDSVALLADAGHNLSDVLGLVVAWGGTMLARTAPTKRFTYGLKGSTILAALTNALLLLVALGAIVLEASQRFSDPAPTAGLTVSMVAGIGIVVNAVTAWMFARGRKGDVNIRGAYLHMAADALVSAGVVVAGLVILATGYAWVDPLVSLVIVAVILGGTWGLFRESLGMALNAVPKAIDPTRVSEMLNGLPGVARVHDLHIWAMSTTETALTAHLVMPGGHPGDAFLNELQHSLDHDFGIAHATVQIEVGTDGCAVHAH